MSAVKVSASLEGVASFLRAVKLTQGATHANTIRAIEAGTKRVATGARARAPKQSGELAYTIRDEYSKDRMTGFVKAGFGTLPRTRASRAMGATSRAKALAAKENRRLQTRLAPTSAKALRTADLGVYAPVVEHGDARRKKPARPYMQPSLASEKSSIIADLGRAPLAGARRGGLV